MTQQLKLESTKAIPEALTNFSSMPDEAYIRLNTVKRLYGVSSATVWRKSKALTMPSPIKLSERCTAWNVGQIRADLAAKVGN